MRPWEVLITTAPRPDNCFFLDETLQELRQEGFDHFVIFAEPGSRPPSDVSDVCWIQRVTRAGEYANWREGLATMARLYPAERYAAVQDDIQLRPGLKAFLERHLGVALASRCVFSPFISPYDRQRSRRFLAGEQVDQGWIINEAGYDSCGAQFYAFRREMLLQLDAELPKTVPHNKAVDGWVAKYCLEHATAQLLSHVPSLVQHIADFNSALGNAPNSFLRTGYNYERKPIDF